MRSLLLLVALSTNWPGSLARRQHGHGSAESLQAIADSVDALTRELDVARDLQKGRHARRWFTARLPPGKADTPASEFERRSLVKFKKKAQQVKTMVKVLKALGWKFTGGRKAIEGAKLEDLGKLAIEALNEESDSAIEFQKVVSATMQVTSGTRNQLCIRTTVEEQERDVAVFVDEPAGVDAEGNPRPAKVDVEHAVWLRDRVCPDDATVKNDMGLDRDVELPVEDEVGDLEAGSVADRLRSASALEFERGAYLATFPGNTPGTSYQTGIDRYEKCLPIVSTVQNQGTCGSCYVFAGTGVAAINKCAYYNRMNPSFKGRLAASQFVSSKQELLDCSNSDGSFDEVRALRISGTDGAHCSPARQAATPSAPPFLLSPGQPSRLLPRWRQISSGRRLRGGAWNLGARLPCEQSALDCRGVPVLWGESRQPRGSLRRQAPTAQVPLSDALVATRCALLPQSRSQMS